MLSNNDDDLIQDFVFVEIGCGVGNAILPILELEPFANDSNQLCQIPKIKGVMKVEDMLQFGILHVKSHRFISDFYYFVDLL